MIKAVIFDWNGVIADSFWLDHFIFLKECERNGVKVPKSLKFYNDLYNSNIFENLLKIGFKKYNEEDEKFYEKLYLKNINKAPIFPGIKLLLKRLPKKYKIVLVTSNFDSTVRTFIKKYKLENVFDCILTADDSKKKEDNIKKFLDKFSLSKNDVIAVGDTVSDIVVARKLGIRIISTTWGYQSKKTITLHKPDFIATKPPDIVKILEKLDKS